MTTRTITADTQLQRPATLSGRYEGEMTLPDSGRSFLELRLDIDARNDTSPVTRRVSGDFYKISQTILPGQPARLAKTYLESWIVDNPEVTSSESQVTVRGTVRYWMGTHPATTVAIEINWNNSVLGVEAAVTFTAVGGSRRSFACRLVSGNFRTVDLEIDVCASVNQAPLLPSYDTHWHSNRPTNLPQRMLTIETAYQEAGIGVTIAPNPTVIDDSSPQFASWTPALLHDAMETNFSKYSGEWPKWQLWGLVAGLFEKASVGGVMFDAAGQFGGAGKAPERQGFAVFRKHEWFNNLAPDSRKTRIKHGRSGTICTLSCTRQDMLSTSCIRGTRHALTPCRG